MDKIQLEIVTPRGRALTASVDEVTAPSVNGEFGVLPGHLPLLAALRTGIVSYRQGAETTRVAVGAGFAEAGPDKLIILTDEYAERSQLDPVLIRKDLGEVEQQLAKLEGVPIVASEAKGGDVAEIEARTQREVLIARENWLAAQLELYGDPPPATQRPYEEFGPPAPTPDDEIPQDTDSQDAAAVAKPTGAK
jgi:F-type H+-transporting ATPase subunit epsilon